MSDFCYSRSMFDRVFRQAELMDRMMERVGVNAAAAARIDKGMAWYEARTKCIACCSDRQCRLRGAGLIGGAEILSQRRVFRCCR